MLDNLINGSINGIIDFIKNLDKYLKDNKSKILIGLLLIIKKLYGRTIIFDILCTLYSVIVLLYISNDIDKGNNIMANESIKQYGIIGLIIYFIGNTPIINQNKNLTANISKIMQMLIGIFTTNNVPTFPTLPQQSQQLQPQLSQQLQSQIQSQIQSQLQSILTSQLPPQLPQ
jgi:hypothetical protein